MRTTEYIIILFLIIVLYQDLRYRAISWPVFPLLAFTGFVDHTLLSTFMEVMYTSLINLGFLLLILSLSFLYFKFRHVKFKEFSKKYIGTGDLLFFVFLSVIFTSPNFILFFISGLIIILILSIIIGFFNPEFINKGIPLAGFQAFLVLFTILANNILKIDLLHNPSLINQLLQA